MTPVAASTRSGASTRPASGARARKRSPCPTASVVPPAARGLRPRAPASTLRETMAGPPDEHVLERRLPVGDRAYRIRKRVDQVADQLVSAGALEAERPVDEPPLDPEAHAYVLAERFE